MKRTFSRVGAVLVAVVTIVSLFSGLSVMADESIPIYTKYDLDNIRNNLSGNYYLANDIEFTPEDFAEGGDFYNNGTGWKAVYKQSAIPGEGLVPFTGVLDGNGYAIKGLYTNEIGTNVASFIGYSRGTVKNLGMIDSKIIKTTSYDGKKWTGPVGGIVGWNQGLIDNCYNTGDIQVTLTSDSQGSTPIGGIAGLNVGSGDYGFGTIQNCYNTGDITANGLQDIQLGGIVGINHDVITQCYNEGNIEATGGGHVGGIVGYLQSNVSQCYNTGDIYAYKAVVGGIIGFVDHDKDKTTEQCFNSGTITYGEGIAGGIIGTLFLKSESKTPGYLVMDCYNTGDINLIEGV